MAGDLGNRSVYFETDASNNTGTDPGWPEGMAPSRVNDAARALQGALARDWDHRGPTKTSGGTANAHTLTYTVAPAAYYTGDVYCFIAGATNTAAVTMNVNTLGAKNIFVANAACTGGEILSGKVYVIGYDGTQFQMMSSHGTGRGGLIGMQNFVVAGTSTYTPTAGTASVFVEVYGGGGGGGGCALTGAAQAAAGGGGGAGGYATKRITSSFSGVTITVGALGAGGTAGANTGTSGGTSSFGALVSATGGTGGSGSTAVAAPTTGVAGGVGGVSSAGDVSGSGAPGDTSMIVSTSSSVGALGGASRLGGASIATPTSSGAVGANANGGAGGGGNGACNAASQAGAHAGGDGVAGAVIVWEFN